MNNSLKVVLVLAVVWTVRIQAQAQYVEYTDQQGPQSVFVNPDVKQRLAQNAVTLREHLLHRRAALLQWQIESSLSIPTNSDSASCRFVASTI